MNDAGKSRHLPALEVALRQLVNVAMRGDLASIKTLVGFAQRYSEEPEVASRLQEVLAEDERILKEYLKDPPGTVVDVPPEDVDDDEY